MWKKLILDILVLLCFSCFSHWLPEKCIVLATQAYLHMFCNLHSLSCILQGRCCSPLNSCIIFLRCPTDNEHGWLETPPFEDIFPIETWGFSSQPWFHLTRPQRWHVWNVSLRITFGAYQSWLGYWFAMCPESLLGLGIRFLETFCVFHGTIGYCLVMNLVLLGFQAKKTTWG